MMNMGLGAMVINPMKGGVAAAGIMGSVLNNTGLASTLTDMYNAVTAVAADTTNTTNMNKFAIWSADKQMGIGK